MRKNANTRVVGTNVILVPYRRKHVTTYHEWMKCPTLRYLTGSEQLTLEEEFRMQRSWLEDEDKCTFVILDKDAFLSNGEDEADAMIGDTNLFFNEPHVAEIEIMIADVASRGKRRGWESVILMLCYGIIMLSINKYRAKVKLDNDTSIKMFKKLGFQEVSRTIESGIRRDQAKSLRNARHSISIRLALLQNQTSQAKNSYVERSRVFQEITLEREASSDWMSWLHSELRSITPNPS